MQIDKGEDKEMKDSKRYDKKEVNHIELEVPRVILNVKCEKAIKLLYNKKSTRYLNMKQKI